MPTASVSPAISASWFRVATSPSATSGPRAPCRSSDGPRIDCGSDGAEAAASRATPRTAATPSAANSSAATTPTAAKSDGMNSARPSPPQAARRSRTVRLRREGIEFGPIGRSCFEPRDPSPSIPRAAQTPAAATPSASSIRSVARCSGTRSAPTAPNSSVPRTSRLCEILAGSCYSPPREPLLR